MDPELLTPAEIAKFTLQFLVIASAFGAVLLVGCVGTSAKTTPKIGVKREGMDLEME